MFMRILAAILLRRKKQYLRVVKLRNRNVLIEIEEYIPATELLKGFKD